MTEQDEFSRVSERFDLIVNGPALFNAVATALELGVFAFLEKEDGADRERLAVFTGVPDHQLRVLLQALCSTELLVRRHGGYHNSAFAAQLLATDEPASWRDILIGWRRVYYPAFAEMTTALITSTNTALAGYPGNEPTLYQRLGHDSDLERVFHASMAAFSMSSMEALVTNEEFRTVRHLLDVAGGDGTTAAQLVQRHPDLRVTIFDLPSVSALAEANHVGSDRVSVREGDFFTNDFSVGADAILFSHCLEIFSGKQIVRLLRKAADVLPTGGKLLIYGYNVSDDETTGLYSARLSLYLNVLAAGSGMAYPAIDYEQWLREAGLNQVRTYRGLPYEHGLSVGVKL